MIPPPPLTQFVVDKQGRFATDHWSSRVITLDVEHRCLYLSRRHHPELLFYHRMEVQEVVLWPHWEFYRVKDLFQSPRAKLTFMIKGLCGELFCASSNSHTPVTRSTDAVESSGSVCGRIYSTPIERVWMLRCSTADDHATLVQLVSRVLEPKRAEKSSLEDSGVHSLPGMSSSNIHVPERHS